MGGGTDKHTDKHTDTHINTMTRPGLMDGPSEKHTQIHKYKTLKCRNTNDIYAEIQITVLQKYKF